MSKVKEKISQEVIKFMNSNYPRYQLVNSKSEILIFLDKNNPKDELNYNKDLMILHSTGFRNPNPEVFFIYPKINKLIMNFRKQEAKRLKKLGRKPKESYHKSKECITLGYGRENVYGEFEFPL